MRIFSAVLLIPISLYLIYLGPPYSVIFGGFFGLVLFLEWGALCLKNRLPWLAKTSVILFGTLYLLIATGWLLLTLSLPEGWALIYWLLFLVWSTDIAAYATGKMVKGPKLIPSVSPNKTWAGFIGGLIIGTAVGYETSFWLFPGVFNFWGIVLLVLIAQGGDLLESISKRWSHVKDSSPLIPGHGGVLDRLDSLLAVSFAIAVWQTLHLS